MLERLGMLGLGKYEIKTYQALLQHGPLKGADLSTAAGVPYGKIYHTLHQLSEKGFINIIDQKPQRFAPIEPDVAIRNAVRQRQEDLDLAARELQDQLAQIKRLPGKESPLQKIQVLSGRSPTYELGELLFRKAQQHVRYIFTYEERPSSFVRLLHSTAKRGVKITLLATQKTPQAIKWMKEDIQAGIEVKYAPIEEIRLQVRDNQEARITIRNPENPTQKITIYFQSPEFARFAAEYFDLLWKKAQSIP
ncbi:TrmB family transcriptional regulator [Candidatus Woesearchaeota archaeon]|nr:TrmB family transcriptional regulator [Candidatus Woesearchaeota archaeon]